VAKRPLQALVVAVSLALVSITPGFGQVVPNIPSGKLVPAPPLRVTVRANPGIVAPGKNITVTVNLAGIMPSQPSDLNRSRTFNITITTLGNLLQAKNAWVKEEIQDRVESHQMAEVQWPTGNAKPTLAVISNARDIAEWRLPVELSRSLERELNTERPPRGDSVDLIFGRTTNFFLATVPKGEKGEVSYTFKLGLGYGSGSFFIFAEDKGASVGSAVVKLQPQGERLPDSNIAFAATSPEAIPADWAVTDQTPIGDKDPRFIYLLAILTATPLDQDCTMDLSITGPMTFANGATAYVLHIPKHTTESENAQIESKPRSTLTKQDWVIVTMKPRVDCPPFSGLKPESLLIPPSPAADVLWRSNYPSRNGNGLEPIQISATVLDSTGLPSTEDKYQTKWHMVLSLGQQSGYGDAYVSSDTPSETETDTFAVAKWSILGHFQVNVRPNVTIVTSNRRIPSRPYRGVVQFTFPALALVLAFIGAGMVRSMLARDVGKAPLAAILAAILYVVGFFGAFLGGKNLFGVPIDPSKLPFQNWPFGLVFGGLIGFAYEKVASYMSTRQR